MDEVSDPSIANQGLSPKKRLLDRLSQTAQGPAELRWTHNKSDVQEVCHLHFLLHACLEHDPDLLVFSLWHDKDYMFLWVTRSIARFSRRLIHKTRQVQHNMSHCGILAGEEKQAKSWERNLVSFWIQFKGHTQVFHLRRRQQDGHVTCLKHVNLGRTWWCRWKVDDATFHAGFCLGVGEHEGLITTAKFRRSTIIPCMLLQSFDCRSRSNRPCAAKVKNHVCRMVSKIQRVYRHPCSVSFCAKPPSIWSPGIVSPMAGRPIVSFPNMAVSFFVGCFWGWKSGLRIKFLPCLFLFGPFLCLCCGDNRCLRLCLGGKGENHPSDSHHCLLTSLSCPCFLWTTKQSPLLTKFRKECSSASLGYTFVLSFSLSSSSFQLAALIWSGLPDTLSVVPCPETWSFIINVTLLASHFILGPLSKVVFSIVFHDGGSVHATDVSAHAEWRILHRAFRLTK